MRYIGRIITNGKLEGIPDLIDVTSDTSTISLEHPVKIPTLIIGLKLVESIFGKVSLIDRNLGKNLYWTFSKRERRIENEKDVRDFISKVSLFLSEHCSYEYIDTLTDASAGLEKISEILKRGKRNIILETQGMYYIYSPTLGYTHGVSKAAMVFVGINEEVESMLSNPNNTIINDEKKIGEGVEHQRYMDPMLYYLYSF